MEYEDMSVRARVAALNNGYDAGSRGGEGFVAGYLAAYANVVLFEVRRERERQESLRLQGKFRATCATVGEHEMTDPECLAVLGEEFGEAARAVSEGIAGNSELGRTHLREELIQVAAVAVAWAERL